MISDHITQLEHGHVDPHDFPMVSASAAKVSCSGDETTRKWSWRWWCEWRQPRLSQKYTEMKFDLLDETSWWNYWILDLVSLASHEWRTCEKLAEAASLHISCTDTKYCRTETSEYQRMRCKICCIRMWIHVIAHRSGLCLQAGSWKELQCNGVMPKMCQDRSTCFF